MVEFLYPGDPRCYLTLNFNTPVAGINNDDQRVALFKEKLTQMCKFALIEMETTPLWFQFKGTE